MNEPGLFTADYRSKPGRVEGWRGTPSFEDSVLLEQVDDSAAWSRWIQPATATTKNVQGWIGVLMTEHSSLKFPGRKDKNLNRFK